MVFPILFRDSCWKLCRKVRYPYINCFVWFHRFFSFLFFLCLFCFMPSILVDVRTCIIQVCNLKIGSWQVLPRCIRADLKYSFNFFSPFPYRQYMNVRACVCSSFYFFFFFFLFFLFLFAVYCCTDFLFVYLPLVPRTSLNYAHHRNPTVWIFVSFVWRGLAHRHWRCVCNALPRPMPKASMECNDKQNKESCLFCFCFVGHFMLEQWCATHIYYTGFGQQKHIDMHA